MQYFSETITTKRVHLGIRLFANILLLLVALAGFWWIAFACAVVCILFFGLYEVLFVGILLDSIYRTGTTHQVLGDFTFTILLCLCISASFLIIPHIRGFNSHI